MAQWYEAAPIAGNAAPGVIKGPPKEPPPQTAAQATKDSLDVARTQQLINRDARTAEFDARKAEADAERARLDAEKARREAANPAMNATESERKASAFLSRAIGSNRSYEATGVGPRSLIGQKIADSAPNVLNTLPSFIGNSPERQVSDTAQDEFIAASLRQDSGAAIPDAELERQRRIYFPMPGDGPEAIEQKRQARLRAIDGLYQATGRALTDQQRSEFEKISRKVTEAVTGAPAGPGDIGFSGNTPPPGAPPLTPPQQAAYDAFNAANPKASADQLRAFGQSIGVTINNADAIVQARDQGGGVQPGAEAVFKAPDISDVRGDGGAGEQIDAIIRGAADVPTLSFADEISAAGDTIFNGGTYDENLRRQRAIDAYDAENNFWFRTGGQLAGGLALPSSGLRAGVGRLAGEGAAYGAGYGFGSGEGDFLDRGSNALIGAAIGAGTAALAGAGGRAISSRLGRPRVGEPAAEAIQGGEEIIFNGSPNTQAERNALMQAADRQGITMMPADVGGTGTRMAAGIVGRTLGGIPMAEGADAAIESARAARDRIAGTLGTVTDETGAGQAAQRGAKRWLDSTDKRASSFYERVPVRPDRSAVLQNTRQALSELTQGLDSNPELSRIWAENPRLKATLEALTVKTQPIMKGAPEGAVSSAPGQQQVGTALEGGQLSWADMKRFRSIIGEIAGRPALSDDGNQIAAMRKLYAALSEDMRATAAAEGPAALKAFNRANDYYRARQARVDGVLTDILGADYLKGEQAAFEQVNRWAQKSGGDSKALGVALRSMGDEADTVRASLIARMGQATAGRQNADGLQFSPAEFVTQWNKLSARAKSILFPDADHRAALNDLARVNAGMKRATQYSNFSNTSLGTNALAHVAGLLSSPLTTLAIAGGEFGAGKLLASPRFARWLARAPKDRNPKLHIQRLSTIAAREPAIAQEALGLQKYLLNAINDNVAGKAAASGDEGQRNER